MGMYNAQYRKTGRVGKSTPTLRQYIAAKLYMMRYELCIKLTDEEIVHFHMLETENDVDRYAHSLIVKKL